MSLQLASLGRIALHAKDKAADLQQKAVLASDNPYRVPEVFADFAPLTRIRSGAQFMNFRPYAYQQKVIELIESHENIIIIKDRQLGLTETIGCWLLFKAMIGRAFLGAVISLTQTKSSEVSDRIKNLPSGMRGVKWDRASATKLIPTGCGQLQFLPSIPNAARSLASLIALFFDEAAFADDMMEILGCATAAQEAVNPEDRKVILVSTIPESGPLCEFWGLFDDANGDIDAASMLELARNAGTNCDIPGLVVWTDKSDWAKIVISHKAHPIYGQNPNYLAELKRRKRLTNAVLQREHNLGLEFGLGSLFDADAIKRNAIGQWQEPIDGAVYVAGIDPNFGGSDYWVLLIWKVNTQGTGPHELVAEYREHERSVAYCRGKSKALIKKYNCYMTAIESNSGGAIVLEDFVEEMPDHVFERVLTSHVSKRVNTDRIALGLEDDNFIFPPDWAGISEMRTFSAIEREASSGHDDTIMSWAAAAVWIEFVVEEAGSTGWAAARHL